MPKNTTTVFKDTKPHYDLLDGLRGVAALMVIWYHIFEGYAFTGGTLIESINHGYLAVNFFFILSGFVIGYAYDGRWGKSLKLKDFFKRRLIRLHPMVIMGAVLGAVAFAMQGNVQWNGTQVSTSMVMLSLLFTLFFIPVRPGGSAEVRGNGEMFLLRHFKPLKVRGAFWICTVVLIALFTVPYLEGTEVVCTNGIYEAFCIIVLFPLLVWLGASGGTTDKKSTKICKFLGDISYPLYVTHYPIMYLFYAWLIEKQYFTFTQTWQVALCVYTLSLLVAYLCLKLYDEPVRKYLAKRFLHRQPLTAHK